MFVRGLISLAPSLRESGASEVLFPPLALPQIAQSSVPRALRLTSAGAGSWATLPSIVPVLESVAHGENADVFPDGSVAVAVTTVPAPDAGTVTSKLALPPPSVTTSVEDPR